MGCVQYFRKHSPRTKIIAVDSVGSVTFGQAPGKRLIPGLGSSQMPPIFRSAHLYKQQVVDERATVAMCRWLAKSNGVLSGGSTGTVVAGLAAPSLGIPRDAVVVAISPDAGERYLDTLYNDEWVMQKFGRAELSALHSQPIGKYLKSYVHTFEGEELNV
jgi:cysteine synthase A